MCFLHRGKPKLHIATEDIVCYKKLAYPSLISPHRYMKYKRNVEAYSDLDIPRRVATHLWEINRGLHSLQSDGHDGIYINMFKAIIPKGAKYYKNDHEYVSNRLIVVRKMKENRKNYLK